jgi:ABC-type glycerol-3-phosphate transport system permease component
MSTANPRKQPMSLRIILTGFLVLWVIMAAFPFLWTLWGSFKVEGDFFSKADWLNALRGTLTKVETGEAFTAGQQIQLAFFLPNNPGQLTITGEILWNGRLGIGLQFKELSRKQIDLIAAFMGEK